jgi:hydroxymethylglutaryl-CoA lyase
MAKKGINVISLADTVGLATPEQVSAALRAVIPQYPSVNFGVHLHSTATNWRDKLEAAVNAGCLRFDGALKGIGGCPMAQDDLVGNMTTEYMVDYFKEKGLPLYIDKTALAYSLQMASGIFI